MRWLRQSCAFAFDCPSNIHTHTRTHATVHCHPDTIEFFRPDVDAIMFHRCESHQIDINRINLESRLTTLSIATDWMAVIDENGCRCVCVSVCPAICVRSSPSNSVTDRALFVRSKQKRFYYFNCMPLIEIWITVSPARMVWGGVSRGAFFMVSIGLVWSMPLCAFCQVFHSHRIYEWFVCFSTAVKQKTVGMIYDKQIYGRCWSLFGVSPHSLRCDIRLIWPNYSTQSCNRFSFDGELLFIDEITPRFVNYAQLNCRDLNRFARWIIDWHRLSCVDFRLFIVWMSCEWIL